MFNDVSIVSTAVSSFNNAALYSPYFLVVGLFMLPLFFMMFWYGRDFVSKFGVTVRDVENKTGFFALTCLVLWLLIFGGNYAVIRDSISLLPVIISGVLFVSVAFVVNRAKKYGYLEKIHDKKTKWFVFLLIMILTGFSAMPTWWGVLLQLSAVVCGIVVGDRWHKELSDVLIPMGAFGFLTVLLLMQPEYFRFGQLGNLTFIHILALLLCGFLCATAFVAYAVKPKEKIYNSAYIKLKWLFRIMGLLALILFVLTESVPVFIGLMLVCMMSESLTIYHGKSNFEYFFRQCWGLFLLFFGVLIICPLISMIGVIYLLTVPNKLDIKDFKKLL